MHQRSYGCRAMVVTTINLASSTAGKKVHSTDEILRQIESTLPDLSEQSLAQRQGGLSARLQGRYVLGKQQVPGATGGSSGPWGNWGTTQQEEAIGTCNCRQHREHNQPCVSVLLLALMLCSAAAPRCACWAAAEGSSSSRLPTLRRLLCYSRINEHELTYGDKALPRQRLPKVDNVSGSRDPQL